MNKETHWADQIASRVILDWPNTKEFICAAGITPSGTVHIGNFREIITVQLVNQALKDKGKKTKYIYSWDDYDRFRKVPENFPKEYKKYLGMPVCDIPDPKKKYKSYAESLEKEAENSLKSLKFGIHYIYQHEKYKNCDYAKEIKRVLTSREKIKEILNKYRKEPLPKSWIPLNVYCEKCKKDFTKILDYDENFTITYKCKCNNKSKLDFRKIGLVNLPWRVDWPMRWDYEKVNFEPGGKEHSTPGGSYTTAKEIIKEIWDRNPPTYQKYDFITIKGLGGKMSSSSGNVITIQDTIDVYGPEVLKYLFVGTNPNKEFSISFDLDVVKIYEDFDKTERIYYKKEKVSNKKYLKEKRIYELSSIDKIPKKMPFQPSFRHLTNVLLMNQLSIEKTIDHYKKNIKTKFEKNRLKTRASCAKLWLSKYAPENFKYSINKTIPKIKLSKNYRVAFKELSNLLKKNKYSEKELHNEFYNLVERHNLNNKEFFKYSYNILISKDKGPKLARFVLDLDKKAIELFSKI